MCRIEAIMGEECIARKTRSHELAARQTTLTTDASPFPLPTLVQAPPSGEAPLSVPPDDGVPETRYLEELVPSSPSKEKMRPQTRLRSRKDSWVYPDPNVFSDSDIEVGAVPGRRAAGSSTTSA